MKHTYICILMVLPGIAWAASSLADIFKVIDDLILLAVQIGFALAVVAFFWGLALYIFKAGDTSANARGLQLMIWGIIALFVMASVWGLVALLQETIGIDNSNAPSYPQLRIN